MRTPHLLLLVGFAACTRPPPPATPTPVPATPDPAPATPDPATCTPACPFGQTCTAAKCTDCSTCTTAEDCEPGATCEARATGCRQCVVKAEAVATPPQTPPTADPRALLLAMESAYSSVRDYTVTMTRRERVKGKLQPQETLQIKFRKPFSTYIKWTGSAYKGREVLYVRGRNGNKIRAHQGSFPDVTVDLDPRGSLAMKGNRHPITEGSLGDLITLLTRDLRRAETRPQDGAIIKDLGESERHGVKVRCFDATFTVADGYYAPHVQVCMFPASNLPSRVQVWDARAQLLEDYEYRDLETNVGLRDADFDSANSRYNF